MLNKWMLTLLGLAMGAGCWWALWRLAVARSWPVGRQLLLLFALSLGLRVVMAWGTPDFYSPDEQSHFNYVKYLAEHRAFPVQTAMTGSAANDWEYYQPPLYYLAQTPIYLASHAVFGETSAVLQTLRLWGLLCWLVTAAAAWRFLMHLRVESPALLLGAMAVVLFLPTQVFLSAMVNNDNLVLALGAVLMVWVARADVSVRASVVMGAVLGLALLTKFSAVVYAVALVCVTGARAATGRMGWRAAVVHLALVAGVSAVMLAPWVARNAMVYGSLTAEEVANVPYTWPSVTYAVRATMMYMGRSFWAVSGIYNNVQGAFPGIGVALSLVSLWGMVRLLASASRRAEVWGQELDAPLWAAFVLAVAVNMALVLRFGLLYAQGQGRLLFPLLIPVALLLSLGWRESRLFRGPQAGLHVAGALLTLAATFMAYSLASFPRLPTPHP